MLAVITALVSTIWMVFVAGPMQGYLREANIKYPSHSKFDISSNKYIPMENIIEKRYSGLVQGPEAIIISQNGDMYTSNGGMLQRLESNNTVTDLIYIGGQILGGAVTSNNEGIYLCSAGIGLIYVDLRDNSVSLVSTISDDGIPIYFADDLALSSDGKIYFSDASTIAPWVNSEGRYAVMLASLYDLLSGSGKGRLLEYDTNTRKTKTLLNNLNFANGVALSPNEDYVLVVETFGFRVKRLWLRGPLAGTSDYFIQNLPGVPDNLRLSPNGGYWIAIGKEVRTISCTYNITPFLLIY